MPSSKFSDRRLSALLHSLILHPIAMASLMPPVASQHLCADAARAPLRPGQLATAAAQGAPQLRSQYKLRWAAPARRQGRQSASGRVPAPAAQVRQQRGRLQGCAAS